MRAPVLVRAALALLCAAGIVVSLIAYDSQRKLDEGFNRVALERKYDSRGRELLEDSGRLSGDTRRELALALLASRQGRDWEPYLERALEREPDNPAVIGLQIQILEAEGRDEEAARAYERASELDPQRFPPR